MLLLFWQASVAESGKAAVDIIKVVTDPFSLLALIVLVLGVLGYLALNKETDGKVRVIALAIVVAALAALGLNSTRLVNAQTTGKAAPNVPAVNVNVLFRGAHQTNQPLTVPFQTSSGQVNFGCGDSAHPTVTFNVPQGARQINATSHWANTDNSKGQDQQVTVTGTTVTAVGTITGLDRNWIGDCPGGGHGELILNGTYVIDKVGSEPITKIVTALMLPGATQTIALPAQTELATESCEVNAASEQGVYGRAVLKIRNENGSVVGDVAEQSGKVDAQIKEGKLSVHLS